MNYWTSELALVQPIHSHFMSSLSILQTTYIQIFPQMDEI